MIRRNHDETDHHYVDPALQLNVGLWTLFAGASIFLALRIWIKVTRRHGLWWDDHILIFAWVRHMFCSQIAVAHNVTVLASCQQCHHHHRICHGLRGGQMGRPDAHTHQHHFLWDPNKPVAYENCFCCHSAQADKEMGPLDTVVHHRQHECIHGRQGYPSMG